jgi:hypothetical protein
LVQGSASSSPASGVLIAFARASLERLTVTSSADIFLREKKINKMEEEGRKESEVNLFFFFLQAHNEIGAIIELSKKKKITSSCNESIFFILPLL